MSAPKNDRAGVKKTFKALTEAGYTITAQDGEGDQIEAKTAKEAADHVMTCDDGYFVVKQDGGERVGFVWFVFGNDPEEVVCDYSTSLSHVLDPLTRSWW